MKKDLYIDGVHYLTAREAGDVLGYAADYISRLCREGKLRGRRSGKSWIVEADSLIPFLKEHEAKKQAWHQGLSRELKAVAEPAQPVVDESFIPLPKARVAPRELHILRGAERRMQNEKQARTRRIVQTTSSALAALALFVVSAMMLSSNLTSGSASAGQVAASSFFAPLENAARATYAGATTLACSITGWCDDVQQPAVVYVRTPGANVATAQPAPAPVQNITNNITNYIQPQVGGTVLAGGVSEQLLDSRLNAMENYLTGRIDLALEEGRRQTSDLGEDIAGIGGAGFDDIDITDSSFTGGSISGASISGSTLSGITFSGSQAFDALTATDATTTSATTTNLYIDGSFGFGSATGLLQANSGAVSTLTNGSNGQVLKMVGGNLTWSTDLTGGGGGGTGAWATTSDDLAIYPADSTDVVLVGDSATTTVGNILEIAGNSLFRGAMTSYGNVTAPRFTATSSVASVFPYASTTALSANVLCISSDCRSAWPTDSAFSTSSADYWKTQNNFFSTSSADYYISQTNLSAFSTTSADFWKDQRNFFSTTSADAWKLTRDFFSTTSASYFLTENQEEAFSSTSAAYFLSQNGALGFSTTSNDYWQSQRNFFSTSSADHYKSVNNFFSTSSADYWQTTKDFFSTSSASYFLSQNQGAAFSTTSAINFVNSSTTIPKTYTANTFTALQTFSNASTTLLSASYASTTNLFGAGLTTCQSNNVLTWNNGVFGCEADDVGSTFAYPFSLAGNATSTLTQFNGGITAYASSTIGNGTAAGGLTVNGTATTSRLVVSGTATSTFAGDILMAGSIIPSADNTYSLGSESRMWKDVYIGPGSLYVNGKKVIEDVSDTITFSTDNDQSLMTETSGVGNNTSRATGSGNLNLLTNSGNVNITSTSGNINLGTTGSGQLNLGTVTSGTWQGTAIGDAYLTKSGNWTGTLDGYEAAQLLGSGFSTTSADYWKTANNFFSTSSASYFSSVGLAFSTTSSDAWKDTRNFFSTSSASYFASVGLAFSTTSNDYWKSVNNFFSTSSADFWKTANDFFSTTSAIYFAHSSTTIPKTYTANTFNALQTFTNASSTLFSSSYASSTFANIGTLNLGAALTVANGGTGSTTLTGLLKGNGTGAIQTAIPGTDYLVSTAGDWTGTFDGLEGAAYLANSFSTTSADFWKLQRDFFSTTSAIYFAHSSTTIPKTYTANTFSALQTFSNASSTLFSSSYASSTNAFFGSLTVGNATSSFGNGLNITAGCYAVNGTCLSTGGASLTGTLGQAAYFSGTNTAVGTSTLFIHSNSSVGIGTTTPNAKLSVYGDMFAEGSNRYLSFGTTTGTNGYGFRDNGGVMEFKNAGGTWQGVTTATTGPSFHVTKGGSSQTVSAGVVTVLDWTTETFDTNNNFDLSTERFTPTVPGKYIVHLGVYCGVACSGYINKNGSAVAENLNVSASQSMTSTIVDMNGTTDYLDATVYNNGTSVDGTVHLTYFTGAMIAPVNGNNAAGWANDGTSSFLLDNADRVGIGTTTPWSKLSLNGDLFVEGSNRYINFGTTATGTNGYGIRDNAGTLEFKNSGGSWTGFGTGSGGAGGGQLLATYATSTPGSNVRVNFNGSAGSQPSFSGGTLTLPSNTSYMVVEMWGGGGGGGGGGSSGAGGNGNSGGTSSFGNGTGSGLATTSASGGSAGEGGNFGGPYGTGGSAGTGSGGDINITGIAGETGGAASGGGLWGNGGSAPRGGGGGRVGSSANCGATGENGMAFGGGGGGGTCTGAGGGGGGYTQKLITPVSGTYYYNVGAGGGGGSAGTGGAGGGNGGTGGIVISVYTTGISQGAIGGGAAGYLPYYTDNTASTSLSATSTLFLSTAGNFGIGSTSPSRKLSVDGTAFIGTGTNATSTFNNNLEVLGGLKVGTTSIYLNGNSTSTFSHGIQSSALNITGGTSTFANGINLTGGCLAVNGTCFQGGSSLTGTTGQLAYFSGTNTAVGTSTLFLNTNSFVGIGTTTPNAKLSVYGDAFLEGTNRYLSFGTTTGSLGYGFRDNAGVMEFKNANGTWQGVTTATTGPSFSVNRNGSSQTVTPSTPTLLNWTTEAFDTNNNFDLSTDRFTPTVPGKYLLTLNVACDSAGVCLGYIYKNGNIVAQNLNQASAGFSISAPTSIVVDMNGTSDYVEAFGYSGSASIVGDVGYLNFSGTMIAPVNGNNAAGWANDGTASFLLDNADRVGIGTTTPWSKLALNGDLFMEGSNRYINFGSTATGTNGYGIRDNAGTLEWKNSSGSWAGFGTGSGGSGGGQLLATYATSTVGTTTVNFNGTAGSAPSFSGATLTLPSNTSYVVVEVWGGGGGGGGSSASTNGGSGGGGGGYAGEFINNPSGTYYFSVAPGGSGGSSGGTSGTAGNVSCFGTNSVACSSPLLSAGGGTGGGGNSGVPGSSGSGSGGDVNLTGGSGWQGTASVGGGSGGNAPRGGSGGLGQGSTSAGTDGAAFGGGGGGGFNARAGGAGGTGGVVISVYTTGISQGAIGSGAAGFLPFYSSSVASTSLSATSSIFLATSGNVGIGTTSPSNKLHVYSTSDGSGITVDGTTNPTLTLSSNNTPRGFFGAVTAANGLINGSIANDVALRTQGGRFLLSVDSGSSAAFMVNASGVGIGTTTPQWLLNPTSASAAQLSLSAGAGLAQWAFRNAGGDFFLATTTVAGTATTSSAALSISGSGFGTTTIRGLNIIGQATSTSNVGINLSGGCFSISGTCIGGQSLSGTTGQFAFFSGTNTQSATSSLFLATNSNIGIGTTTPNAKLSVYGDIFAEGSNRYLSFGTTTGTNGYGFRDNAGVMEFKNAGGTWQGVTTATTGPSFSVHKNGSSQTVTANVVTKLTWPTEVFDTNNNFANDRFTPTVPGKYMVTATAYCRDGTTSCEIYFYKNGSAYTGGFIAAGEVAVNATVIADMNGVGSPGTELEFAL